jgi:hypothetical protein
LYTLYGILPSEFTNDVLKTKKIFSQIRFCIPNTMLKIILRIINYTMNYILKYSTDNCNQYLQVIKCHNCNSQWKEIWTRYDMSSLPLTPSKQKKVNEVSPHPKTSRALQIQ